MTQPLETYYRHLRRLVPDVLRPGVETLVARAPARLDVMGGVSDYMGGTVLEATLDRAAVVAVQRRTDRRLVAYSCQAEANGWQPRVELSLDDLYAGRRLKPPDQVRRLFAGDHHWAAYVLGAAYILLRGKVVTAWPSGATLVLDSTIPIGVAVASSGALEVASMRALTAAFGIDLEPLRLARLCQLVENVVAGAPCGIMDQVTQSLCQAGQLLELLCQPCEILGLHSLPEGAIAAGINSAVRHSVGGRPYRRARVSCFMAMKIIATHLGDDPYGGYLCNIAPDEFRRRFRPLLPATIRGRDFLARYGETGDPATAVDPDEDYGVLGGARFAVGETARARRLVRYLTMARQTGDATALEQAGRLMYKSHWAYSNLIGLGSAETDLIMRLIRRRGPAHGFYGARSSGGGSGGTMAVLCRADALDALDEVAAEYGERTGRDAQVFAATSPGALAFGVRRLRL
jgi:L-arabinokinase